MNWIFFFFDVRSVLWFTVDSLKMIYGWLMIYGQLMIYGRPMIYGLLIEEHFLPSDCTMLHIFMTLKK